MSFVFKILLFVTLPHLLFAAGSGGDVDIVERTINFVIFFAILYYFAFAKVAAIFKERKNSIADSLSKIQEKLQETKREKQKAIKCLEDAKRQAEDIIEAARKEALVIAKQSEDNTNAEIENLVKQFNDDMSMERRKIEKLVVSDILDEFLNKDSLVLDKDVLMNTLLKKVA